MTSFESVVGKSPEPLLSTLRCPVTKQRLQLHTLQAAVSLVKGEGDLRPRAHGTPGPVGPTPTVLVREDHLLAFPVLQGIPILLAPEALARTPKLLDFDLRDPRYAEAYEEMSFYTSLATKEATAAVAQPNSNTRVHPASPNPFSIVARCQEQSAGSGGTFPDPPSAWLHSVFDCGAQYDAYCFLAPVSGRRALQIGGKGLHVVKFLIAGAVEGWLVTPMIGEAVVALQLAERAGVRERFRCVVGIAEELPLAERRFDRVFAGGSVHHMITQIAFPEIANTLVRGGRFAAIDPWHAPFYNLGIKIFGKRVPEVRCRPLTRDRVAPLATAFSNSTIIHHGALTRYPLIALDRLGLHSSLRTVWNINKWDNRIASVVPRLRRFGSSVALLATS